MMKWLISALAGIMIFTGSALAIHENWEREGMPFPDAVVKYIYEKGHDRFGPAIVLYQTDKYVVMWLQAADNNEHLGWAYHSIEIDEETGRTRFWELLKFVTPDGRVLFDNLHFETLDIRQE